MEKLSSSDVKKVASIVEKIRTADVVHVSAKGADFYIKGVDTESNNKVSDTAYLSVLRIPYKGKFVSMRSIDIRDAKIKDNVLDITILGLRLSIEIFEARKF